MEEKSSRDERYTPAKRACTNAYGALPTISPGSGPAAKRACTNTYGVTSTSSHGSDSDDDSTGAQYSVKNTAEAKHLSYAKLYSRSERSPKRTQRLSSESCSSSNEHDDNHPSFKDNHSEESSRRDSYQLSTENTLYSHTSKQREYGTYSSFKDDDAEGRMERSSSEISNQNACYNKTSDYQSDLGAVRYSDVAKKLMSSMGHMPGKGLGKNESGRVEPVEASTQQGRRGLGSKASLVGRIPNDFKWTPDNTPPEAEEIVSWMPTPPEQTLSADILKKSLKMGPKKTNIDDETNFVDRKILKGVLNCKTIFDSLDGADMRNARLRSNPYETIGSAFFLNRAAVKMANMDAVFDFMFTKPKKQNGEPEVDEKDLLYFADVCAGPGGFSEYVLYRKGWRAKGFGFTLKGSNDFKLSEFCAGSPETFNPYYGEKGDGDIFKPENLISLKEFVLKQTNDIGVHFLMGDGGFSVEGSENIQEILSKQLYLCQCIAALMLVRTGGHFVVKLFDVFTQFSVGLIYIMYRCFVKVSIHKPVTSRPANSERYLVCKWKKPNTEAAEDYLFAVNKIIWENRSESDDVSELVPLSIITEDQAFYEYIYNSNCLIGEKQIKNLLKIAAYSRDKNIKESSQAEMKRQCLELWHIPNKIRKKVEVVRPEDTLGNILNMLKSRNPDLNDTQLFKKNVLSTSPRYMKKSSDLTDMLKVVYDWHFTILSSGNSNIWNRNTELKIIIACGGKLVYQMEEKNFKNIVDAQINLPANTLLYAEKLNEYCGEGNKQIHSKALHIVDALVLGGIDISGYSLTERINQCNLFCNALEKPDPSTVCPIRCKSFFPLETFPTAIANLQSHLMKRMGRSLTVDITKPDDGNNKFYTVGSILFLKEIKDPWVAQISKRYGSKYYYCMGPDNRSNSVYELPDGARLDMLSAYQSRVIWNWESPSAVSDAKEGGVSRVDIEKHVRSQ